MVEEKEFEIVLRDLGKGGYEVVLFEISKAPLTSRGIENHYLEYTNFNEYHLALDWSGRKIIAITQNQRDTLDVAYEEAKRLAENMNEKQGGEIPIRDETSRARQSQLETASAS